MTADEVVVLAEILLGEARNLLLTAASTSPVGKEHDWLMRVVYAIEEHCLDDLADWNVKGDL